MNKVYCVFLASILAFAVEGRVFRIIDDFTDAPYNVLYVTPSSGVNDHTAPYSWYSPYENIAFYLSGTPYANFRNAANVIGGQRDIIIGHVSYTPTVASISCTVNSATETQPANFQFSLPDAFIGGIYLQYDGIDDSVSASTGALLGKNIGGDNGAGSNTDGTVDFTFGGLAKGIQISIQTDSPVDYEIKVARTTDDPTGYTFGNYLSLSVPANALSGRFTTFYITFDDADWSDNDFDWTRVASFQVKVLTAMGASALTSSISLIQIGTLQIGGTVSGTCLCESDLFALSGIRVNLFDTSVSTTSPRAFTTTDANGDYSFSDEFISSGKALFSSTTPFRICLDDSSLVHCADTQPLTYNGCYDFFITDTAADSLEYDFTISRTATIEIPDSVTVVCAVDSTHPDSSGYAYVTDCSGNRSQISTWTDDTPITIGCVSTINRVWTDASSLASGTQTITAHISGPIIESQASDLTVECDLQADSLNQQITAWLIANGNAVATGGCIDPSALSWTNSFSGTPINSTNCGFTETVTFTVSNGCGASSSTSAVIRTHSAAPTTQGTAQYISLPYENTVNGDLLVDYEIPAEWEGIGVTDALWYRVLASSSARTIVASTCTTPVDTVLAILVPVDGTLTLVASNDDRTDSLNDCALLSSYVEYTVPANSEFYIVLAAYTLGGNVDLSVYEKAATCEQLIVQAESEIISSLTSEIASSTSLLLSQYDDLADRVSQVNSDINNGISGLSSDVFDQFSQLQINLGLTRSNLSSSIINSEYNLSVQVEELAGSVYNLAYDVQAVAESVGTVDAAVSALANNLNVPGALAAVAATVDSVANTQLPEVSNAVNWLAANTETNFEVLQSLLNGRFDSTDGSVAQVFTQTNTVLTSVEGVNTVVSQVKSYLETVNFERYLISSPSDISSVPWQYRTPATYMGKMDDVLNFVIQTYNTKFTSCIGSSSAGCVWFRSNTSSSYSTLVSTYNMHVSNQRFKKAFDVLQTFYLKMFPTSLFV